MLLDTHAFLWLDAEPAKLSETATQVFQDPDNEIYLSIANLWEIQLKAQLGRLTLRLPLPELVQAQQTTNDIRLLSLEPEHSYELGNLPLIHGDPFDRVLMAHPR